MVVSTAPVVRRLLASQSRGCRSYYHHHHHHGDPHQHITLQRRSVLPYPLASLSAAVLSTLRRRYLATTATDKGRPIRILYASSTGTAQLFATQLADSLKNATVHSLHEGSPNELLDPKALHLFIVSTAGVGEPPSSARDFMDQLLEHALAAPIDYAMFGLGNSRAHPHHYNSFSNHLDSLLQELNCTPILDLTLGDDGDCIDDDFDQWQTRVLELLDDDHDVTSETSNASSGTETTPESSTVHTVEVSKGPPLLQPFTMPYLARTDLLDVAPEWYRSDARRFTVLENINLNKRDATANGLRELTLQSKKNTEYETGDHLVVYPRNAEHVVESYLRLFNIVHPNDKVTHPSFPSNISSAELLSHCLDLSAVPSPKFAKLLMNSNDIQYKTDIAEPRRTTLDLALESSSTNTLSVNDFLQHQTRMQPRYYSIASSNLEDTIKLTYRPVRYLTSQGHLRLGVATSHLCNLTNDSTLACAISSNPLFRLPSDPKAPILMVAGGCGVAPIRAFLRHRLLLSKHEQQQQYGEALLFVGFRNPADQVYGDLIQDALASGALTESHVSFANSDQKCSLVSETLHDHGRHIWEHVETPDSRTYVCGGARTFGVAVENVVYEIIQEYGGLSPQQATEYLKKMIAEGRFCEDLAD